MANSPQHGLPSNDLARVSELLDELKRNLQDAKLSLQRQERCLLEIKVLGRNPETAVPIFAKQSISTLLEYGLDRESTAVSHEALRCLANAFLLDEPSRQTFVDLGYGPKAAERLKLDDENDEFLISRILFLMTYNTTLNFDDLVNNKQLATSINDHLVQHAGQSSHSRREHPPSALPPNMALNETLKLLFNISHFWPDLKSQFGPSIEPLVNLVVQHDMPAPPLQPPTILVLNALMNLISEKPEERAETVDKVNLDVLFPPAKPTLLIDRLVSILEKSIQMQPEKDLDQAAMPLCALIRRVHELAPAQVRESMRQVLLPADSDREKPLGSGQDLASCLLRLSCSAGVPTLRENISALLYELSDKDATTFVKNVGYGFASGYLVSHNIEVPPTAMEGRTAYHATADIYATNINPVTGQRLDAEIRHATEEVEMTQEEKEREAERLFVLFERLRATGVMDVRNPVQQAVDEGRFEELD